MNCPHCNAPAADDSRFCGVCGQATSSTEPAPPAHLEAPVMIGREIAGRYRIIAKLGEGGMGAVFKAEQISLKRVVAVKLLRPDVSGSALLLRRFNAEAEAVAKLSHPNTVNIYDFGQDTDGSLFIAMEFIEGRSLRELVQTESPLEPRRALTIAAQVAASLTDAHAHSIVHRDLKPDNVMLQDRGRSRDVARVLDFGIAKLRDDSRATQQAMTQAGDMLGTPQYMAPEQIRAEAIDGRTDVYALGCMMYEMVTARLPFEAPTIMAMLSKHLTEVPLPPSQRRPELAIPPHVDELIMTAMAKDVRQRQPTMEALGEQINAVLATLPGGATSQLSAVVGVPQVAGLPVNTPGFGAPHGYHPPTPGPFPVAPGTAGYPTPPPPGYAPTPQGGGYGVGGGGPMPATTPPPASYPPPQLYPPPPAGGASKTVLWVVVALLAIGAVGGGIYFATQQSGTQVAAGSGSGDDPDTDDTPLEEALEKLSEFKDAICACDDVTCAMKVQQDMAEWAAEVAKIATPENTAELSRRMTAVAQEMAQCMAKAAGADQPVVKDPWGGGGTIAPKPPGPPKPPSEPTEPSKPTDPVDPVGPDDPDDPDDPEEVTEAPPPRPRPPPPPPRRRSLNQQVDDLAARACRCSNAVCARRVVNDLVSLAIRNKDAKTDEPRAEASAKRLAECALRAGMSTEDLMAAFQKVQ